jgi:hypothetical protein
MTNLDGKSTAITCSITQVDGVSAVHSHYYLLASDLYRLEGKHADFYRSAKFLLEVWNRRD